MDLFKRWKSKKTSASANQMPIAEFGVKIHPNRVEFILNGDEQKIGGALVTLMLNNQQTRKVITNSVIAVERECERQESFLRLMAINLN